MEKGKIHEEKREGDPDERGDGSWTSRREN